MTRRTMLLAALAVSAALATACKRSGALAAPTTIRVAAAADLAFAFKDAGEAFERTTGTHVTFTFGSTGNLAKQIAQGAPYDLFAAASVSYVDDVVRAGECDGATKAPYARGRIAVWMKSNSNVAPPSALSDLADPRFTKIAIANPEHAPYGRAAEEALESAGVWGAVKPKLVFGENVQQTLEFAQTGNVDAAIVALSLVTVTAGGTSLVIDESAHGPIDQALVVCTRGGNAAGARAFAAFIAGPDGRAIMRRYGFLLPGESAAK